MKLCTKIAEEIQGSYEKRRNFQLCEEMLQRIAKKIRERRRKKNIDESMRIKES